MGTPVLISSPGRSMGKWFCCCAGASLLHARRRAVVGCLLHSLAISSATHPEQYPRPRTRHHSTDCKDQATPCLAALGQGDGGLRCVSSYLTVTRGMEVAGVDSAGRE